MTTDNRLWKLTPIELPDPEVLVETKIDDARGIRNEYTLYYARGHWFDPDSGMYMYYTPTHWRPLRELTVTRSTLAARVCTAA